MPDPYWIEKVVAAVVPIAEAKLMAEQLEAFARTKIAAFKVPKEMPLRGRERRRRLT